MEKRDTGYNEKDAKSILKYIYENYDGINAFKMRGKALGIFMDCASTPHLRKEIAILKALEESGKLQELANTSSLSKADQQKMLNLMRDDLVSNKAMDEVTVIQFLQTLSEALNWTYKSFQKDCANKSTDLKSQQERPRKKSSTHKPVKEVRQQLQPLHEVPKQQPTEPRPTKQPVKQQPAKQKTAKHNSWLFLLLLVVIGLVIWLASQKQIPRDSVTSESSIISSSTLSSSEDTSEAQQEKVSLVLPNVVNQDKDAACRVLEEKGITVNISYQYDAFAETGTVIAQNPSAGTEWNGKSVELVICDKSLGMVTVPNVVGMSLPAAKETLEEAGFTTSVKLSGNETAVVKSQKPTGGTEAEKGSNIILSYEEPAVSENQTRTETSGTSNSSASHSAPTPATSPAETQQQSVQPAQTVSAYISSCNKSIVQFVTSGGEVTVYVEFIYPGGEPSGRFSLGTFTDGSHEFSPGVSIADPQGTYQVHLYDANNNLLASSSFTN